MLRGFAWLGAILSVDKENGGYQLRVGTRELAGVRSFSERMRCKGIFVNGECKLFLHHFCVVLTMYHIKLGGNVTFCVVWARQSIQIRGITCE